MYTWIYWGPSLKYIDVSIICKLYIYLGYWNVYMNILGSLFEIYIDVSIICKRWFPYIQKNPLIFSLRMYDTNWWVKLGFPAERNDRCVQIPYFSRTVTKPQLQNGVVTVRPITFHPITFHPKRFAQYHVSPNLHFTQYYVSFEFINVICLTIICPTNQLSYKSFVLQIICPA